MGKLSIGEELPDFMMSTAFADLVPLSAALDKDYAILLFLRYYGCPVCQLDIRTLSAGYEQIKGAGAQAFVILQSPPETIRESLAPGDLPFPIICDEGAELYRNFAIDAAGSSLKMLNLPTLRKASKAKKQGIKHGKSEGIELQLPAVFIINRKRRVEYMHYGANIADVPSPAELVGIIKSIGRTDGTFL